MFLEKAQYNISIIPDIKDSIIRYRKIKPPKKPETVKEPVIQQNELSSRPKITNFGSNPYKTNLALTRPQTGLRVGGL